MTSALLRARPDLLPTLAVALSGALWGLFWIPMRLAEEGGLPGGWGAAVFFLPAVAVLIPVAFRRRGALRAGGLGLIVTGFLTGSAFAFYAVSLAYTDVVRSILLFYLTPIWSTILGRFLLGERVTATRVAALVLGLAGLAVILGAEDGFPWPRNAGDWLALAAGIGWAYGSLRVYQDEGSPGLGPGVFEQVFVFLACGWVVTLAVLLLLPGGAPAPPLSALSSEAAIVLGVLALATLPTAFLILWGASRLSPARVGILLMMEIVVGVTTAALWAGEAFGLPEVAGTLLILSAAAAESLRRPG